MQAFNISDVIALGSLALAMTTTATGAILWYVQGEKKKYASERDFQHIKRNQEQISIGIDKLTEELEHQLEIMGRDVLEIKIMLGINRNNED